MKRIVLLGFLIGPIALTNAQEATPTPGAAVLPPAESAADGQPPSGDPAALAPVLREKVDLTETGATEAMEIPIAPDAPNPDKTGEVSEPLPGDEDAPQRPAVTGTVEVTAANNGRNVKASLGNLVRISLESNPSTGYNWELRDFDYGVADFYSSDVVARKDGNVLVGAPGDTVITLQAVKAGTQPVTLVYRRPWEAPDQVAATFSFQLEVAGDAPAPSSSPEASPAP